MAERWTYHDGILRELRRHGFIPRPTSDPEKVYELLKSLYAFEIRDLKLRRREAERVLGPQPLSVYRRQLADLKERYPVLAIPAHHWVKRGSGSDPEGDDPPEPPGRLPP